ncbi:hypothetical protein SAMN04487995_0937 [Dyadobacter koreensis]|uniref:Uncharacterized protein n=1 Tax=Dyadobacter koreensis TaxID=408657 RepID=A0A1H6R1H7_9BACT|nr:hypothetical protein SAMN04487995_0937 [Dyadobacter koreensis]
MKFSDNFKLWWWILLLLSTASILGYRLGDITSGNATTNDSFLLGLFVAMMLVPIFAEMEFLGIKLKQEIDELKESIRIQFGDIKSDIRNSQNQTLNATFHSFGPPPSENKLSELKQEIEIIKSNPELVEVEKEGVDSDIPTDDNIDLFVVRYKIERIVNRLFAYFFPDIANNQRMSLLEQISQLSRSGLINNDVKTVLPKVLATCNYAIHGRPLTRKQIDFVKDNADVVISALSATYENRDMF